MRPGPPFPICGQLLNHGPFFTMAKGPHRLRQLWRSCPRQREPTPRLHLSHSGSAKSKSKPGQMNRRLRAGVRSATVANPHDAGFGRSGHPGRHPVPPKQKRRQFLLLAREGRGSRSWPCRRRCTGEKDQPVGRPEVDDPRAGASGWVAPCPGPWVWPSRRGLGQSTLRWSARGPCWGGSPFSGAHAWHGGKARAQGQDGLRAAVGTSPPR